jgi:hypothetical protein
MKLSPAVVSTVTEPGSLLSQYKLLRSVIDAPWATRLDHKIASHVIDRYFAKFGNARASLRYLEQATGATRPNIIESLRRITDNGVISVTRQGIGTRPTEYDLNFDFASKSPRGIAGDTQTYLRNLLTSRLTVSRNEGTPAVPTAPPVSSLEADPAATAVDPQRCGSAGRQHRFRI